MRVLVCGGRDFADLAYVAGALDALHARYAFTHLIHGGASGADSMAAAWAISARVATLCFLAEWDEIGPKAGPLRNSDMLNAGKPDLVVVFPGGRGTADMTRKAKAACVPVVELKGPR